MQPFRAASTGRGAAESRTPIVAYLSSHHAWTSAFLIGTAFAVVSAAAWLLVDPTRRVGSEEPAAAAS